MVTVFAEMEMPPFGLSSSSTTRVPVVLASPIWRSPDPSVTFSDQAEPTSVSVLPPLTVTAESAFAGLEESVTVTAPEMPTASPGTLPGTPGGVQLVEVSQGPVAPPDHV
jgi:hypothetical protein